MISDTKTFQSSFSDLSESMLKALFTIFRSRKPFFYAYELGLNKKTLESLRHFGFLDKKLIQDSIGYSYKYHITSAGKEQFTRS